MFHIVIRCSCHVSVSRAYVGGATSVSAPPAAAAFVHRLASWNKRLATHFKLSPSCFASNPRRAAARIRRRISFLPPERVAKVMSIIEDGYKIPFLLAPPAFHRPHNSPDLSDYMDEVRQGSALILQLPVSRPFS